MSQSPLLHESSKTPPPLRIYLSVPQPQSLHLALPRGHATEVIPYGGSWESDVRPMTSEEGTERSSGIVTLNLSSLRESVSERPPVVWVFFLGHTIEATLRGF